MAVKYIDFKGKALWCRPWPDMVDRMYEDERRGGNWSTKLIVDNDTLKVFNALGSRAKAQRIEDLKKTDGLEDYLNARFITLRRYERTSSGSELPPLKVIGVDPGTAIGNLSDLTCTVEHYTTEFQSKPVVGLRLVSIRIDNLIPYVKPVAIEAGNDPLPF